MNCTEHTCSDGCNRFSTWMVSLVPNCNLGTIAPIGIERTVRLGRAPLRSDALNARAFELAATRLWKALHMRSLFVTRTTVWLLIAALVLPSTGCKSNKLSETGPMDPWGGAPPTALKIVEPDLDAGLEMRALATSAPHTLRRNEPTEYWQMTLEEAIRLGLNNSRVLRDAGGRVLQNPQLVQSTFDPAIKETDPRQGTIAAESAYDPTFSSSANWVTVDRFFNNIYQGGGTHDFAGSFLLAKNGISQKNMAGGSYSVDNLTAYRDNNAPGNSFSNFWSTAFSGTLNQPLLQGAGVNFNQIAGGSGMPGLNNGVLIARINTDVSLTDFEAALRNYLLDTERAFWELDYAYRDLDARIAARNSALDLWRTVNRKAQAGALGGDKEAEARAREQYYLFQAQVENSLSGTAVTGGSTPAPVGPNANGVFVAERRLRLLLGLPATDQRLIRPSDGPAPVEFVFDWDQVLPEALVRRVELRRQRFQVKRRELELVAARNFLLPKLDLVAAYAFQGFGQALVGGQGNGSFDSAYGNLFSGQHSHYSLMGLQYSQPIGNRIGHTDVRNAELVLARERALLAEQEVQVAHELSAAIAEADRAYSLTRTNFNRRAAAEEQLDAITRKYVAGAAALDPVLDAQRRLADAGSAYYRSVVDFNRALADVHYSRGTLLDYNGVFLAEGPWPAKAYEDAFRQSHRVRPAHMNYCLSGPVVSRQIVPQSTLPPPSASPAANSLPETIPAPQAEPSRTPVLPGVSGTPNR